MAPSPNQTTADAAAATATVAKAAAKRKAETQVVVNTEAAAAAKKKKKTPKEDAGTGTSSKTNDDKDAEAAALLAAESALQAAVAKTPRELQEEEEIAEIQKASNAKKKEHRVVAQQKAKEVKKQADWYHYFFQLAVYKQKNGHVRFPGRNSADETPLSKWVNQQRSTQGKKKLSQDQIAALNALGFVWNVVKDEFDRAWEARYQELVQYKKDHNTTHVPMNYESGLGDWCGKQRSGYKLKQQLQSGRLEADIKAGKIKQPKGHLIISDEHFQKLDAIGFKWEIYKRDTWDARIEELKEYKKRFGHCNVPQHWPENQCLGKFVARQRYNFCQLKQGKMKWKSLTAERMAILEDMGFDWGKSRPNAWKDPQTEEAKIVAQEAKEQLMVKKEKQAAAKGRSNGKRGRPRKHPLPEEQQQLLQQQQQHHHQQHHYV